MASPELTNGLSSAAQDVIATYENPATRIPTIEKFAKVESLIKFYADSPKGFKILNFILCGIPRLIYRIRINALLCNHIKETDKKVEKLKVIFSEKNVTTAAMKILYAAVSKGLTKLSADIAFIDGCQNEPGVSVKLNRRLISLKDNHFAVSRKHEELTKAK